MALLREIERGRGEPGHALERNQIALFEGVRMIGEKFKQAANLAVRAHQRQNDDRGNAENTAGLQIHARIGFCIIAAQ